jgi:hypothetical protein
MPGEISVEVLTKYRVQHLSHGDVRFVAAEILKQPGNAMLHSSRRDRKTKAIAEALAMIAGAHPELESHRLRPVRETDEWLWESATEFCAALDRYEGLLTECRDQHLVERRQAESRAQSRQRRQTNARGSRQA